MFGNLLNNTLIRELIDAREIMITPQFDVARLQIAQYPLLPYAVFKVIAPGKLGVSVQKLANALDLRSNP